MKWEIKQLPNKMWGIFLCKKYWKFKDRPVMYAASIVKESAERRLHRLNNPEYDVDIDFVPETKKPKTKKKAKKKKKETK